MSEVTGTSNDAVTDACAHWWFNEFLFLWNMLGIERKPMESICLCTLPTEANQGSGHGQLDWIWAEAHLKVIGKIQSNYIVFVLVTETCDEGHPQSCIDLWLCMHPWRAWMASAQIHTINSPQGTKFLWQYPYMDAPSDHKRTLTLPRLV